MGIGTEKSSKGNTDVTCICKGCGKRFKHPVPVDFCKECLEKELRSQSSAEMILGDFRRYLPKDQG